MIKKNNIKKFCIVANCTWYLYNFRKEFLEELYNRNYKLILLCPKDKYYRYISKYFVKAHNLNLIRGSENPFFEVFSILQLFFYYLKYKPDLIHHFTIKPAIYGSILARIVRVRNIINHITGLGPSFYNHRLKIKLVNKILEPIYKFGFRNKYAINIFHNNADKNTFIIKKLSTKINSIVIEGSGVDIKLFKKKNKTSFRKEIKILFPARLIREKGIIELIKACNNLWSSNYKFTLEIAGELDRYNRSCLDEITFENIINNKKIKFLGKVENMLKVYKKTDFVVLPSWREGLSKSLLEAASMSLPIITTDVPGCKDIIRNKYSGIIVPLKNVEKLELAIKFYLENHKLALTYGKNARINVIKRFSTDLINKEILNVYDNFLN